MSDNQLELLERKKRFLGHVKAVCVCACVGRRERGRVEHKYCPVCTVL